MISTAHRSSVEASITDQLEAFLRLAEPHGTALIADIRRGAEGRFAKYVSPMMVSIAGGRFEMGTPHCDAAHFCGETPQHTVELSPFAISAMPVTNELYGLFDDSRRELPEAEQSLPVVDVTWVEAALFALWLGCSLPTEAEWEYACAAGSPAEWCCADERDLGRYAWYSENSSGLLHEVATREPNEFGLFDMHGNVWEWCADTYSADFYERSPRRDPMNTDVPESMIAATRVCRGGSPYALAEMCRTRYRQHEPPTFWASDLGFRLVRRDPVGQ